MYLRLAMIVRVDSARIAEAIARALLAKELSGPLVKPIAKAEITSDRRPEPEKRSLLQPNVDNGRLTYQDAITIARLVAGSPIERYDGQGNPYTPKGQIIDYLA